MNRKLIEALVELEKEKGIKMDTLIEALKIAFVSAYKKNYQVEYECRVDIDEKTGEIKVFKILDEGESAGEAAEGAAAAALRAPEAVGVRAPPAGRFGPGGHDHDHAVPGRAPGALHRARHGQPQGRAGRVQGGHQHGGGALSARGLAPDGLSDPGAADRRRVGVQGALRGGVPGPGDPALRAAAA